MLGVQFVIGVRVAIGKKVLDNFLEFRIILKLKIYPKGDIIKEKDITYV
jgi:hypothetical protein